MEKPNSYMASVHRPFTSGTASTFTVRFPLTGWSAVNERIRECGGRRDASDGPPAPEPFRNAPSRQPPQSGRCRKPLRILGLRRTARRDLLPPVLRKLVGVQLRYRSLTSPNVTVFEPPWQAPRAVLAILGGPNPRSSSGSSTLPSTTVLRPPTARSRPRTASRPSRSLWGRTRSSGPTASAPRRAGCRPAKSSTQFRPPAAGHARLGRPSGPTRHLRLVGDIRRQ
jgi:hypothetical protein